MPSKSNQYNWRTQPSNAAKSAGMAPGASQSPQSINIGLPEPLVPPARTLKPVAFPAQAPTQPVAFPAASVSAPVSRPRAPVQTAAPAGMVYPGAQAATSMAYPSASVAAPAMTAQPAASTLEQYPAEQQPTWQQVSAAMGVDAEKAQEVGAGAAGLVQQSQPKASGQEQQSYYGAEEREQGLNAIRESYAAEMEKAEKAIRDRMSMQGLSGSGQEQIAISNLYAQTSRDMASALAQADIEYIRTDAMLRELDKALELMDAQTRNEWLSTFNAIPDIAEGTGLDEAEVLSVMMNAIQSGGGLKEAMAAIDAATKEAARLEAASANSKAKKQQDSAEYRRQLDEASGASSQ